MILTHSQKLKWMENTCGSSTNTSMQHRYNESLHDRGSTHLEATSHSIEQFLDELVVEVADFDRVDLKIFVLGLLQMQENNDDKPSFSYLDRTIKLTKFQEDLIDKLCSVYTNFDK